MSLETPLSEGVQFTLSLSFHKQGHVFERQYVMVILCSNDLRWEVVVHSVAIGGIVDHHCLNFAKILFRCTLCSFFYSLLPLYPGLTCQLDISICRFLKLIDEINLNIYRKKLYRAAIQVNRTLFRLKIVCVHYCRNSKP